VQATGVASNQNIVRVGRVRSFLDSDRQGYAARGGSADKTDYADARGIMIFLHRTTSDSTTALNAAVGCLNLEFDRKG
jgi:hypothetical protein